MSERRRNVVVLTTVAALVAASVLLVIVGIPGVVKARKTRLGLDLKGGVQLVYRARPTVQSKVDTESVDRSIEVMRKRVEETLDLLGIAELRDRPLHELSAGQQQRAAIGSATTSWP